MDYPNLPAPANPGALKLLDGATPFYMTGEDSLQISSFNTAAGVILAIVGRFITFEGRVQPFVYQHTPLTNGTLKTDKFPMGQGWVHNVTVFASAGAPTGSQCTALLRVVHGVDNTLQTLGTLCQGAITTTQEISWPLTIASSGGLTSPGVTTIRSVAGSLPGAGNEITETVPAGKRWRLAGVRFRLTTSAAVANRMPTLLFDDGTSVVYWCDPPALQAASLTIDYSGGDSTQRIAAVGIVAAWQIPGSPWLGPGYRIRTQTTNIQAADVWSPVQYFVEEGGA